MPRLLSFVFVVVVALIVVVVDVVMFFVLHGADIPWWDVILAIWLVG
jgi:hypothetical protein